MIFYMVAPVSAFVATAIIDRIGECPDKTSKWCDKPCAWLRNAKMLFEEITLDHAKQHFPEWRFLKRPTITCIPNKYTPIDLVDSFLAFLNIANPKVEPEDMGNPPDVDAGPTGLEGNPHLRAHFWRERNSSIIIKKKRDVLARTGALKCEVCRFDSGKVYGKHGREFCEVHHLIPLHKADGIVRTELIDLAIVCSNCHRIIHRVEPMPSIAELANVVENSYYGVIAEAQRDDI